MQSPSASPGQFAPVGGVIFLPGRGREGQAELGSSRVSRASLCPAPTVKTCLSPRRGEVSRSDGEGPLVLRVSPLRRCRASSPLALRAGASQEEASPATGWTPAPTGETDICAGRVPSNARRYGGRGTRGPFVNGPYGVTDVSARRRADDIRPYGGEPTFPPIPNSPRVTGGMKACLPTPYALSTKHFIPSAQGSLTRKGRSCSSAKRS